MSFFKRLKDKFATNKENEEVKSLREEQGQDKLEVESVIIKMKFDARKI